MCCCPTNCSFPKDCSRLSGLKPSLNNVHLKIHHAFKAASRLTDWRHTRRIPGNSNRQLRKSIALAGDGSDGFHSFQRLAGGWTMARIVFPWFGDRIRWAPRTVRRSRQTLLCHRAAGYARPPRGTSALGASNSPTRRSAPCRASLSGSRTGPTFRCPRSSSADWRSCAARPARRGTQTGSRSVTARSFGKRA